MANKSANNGESAAAASGEPATEISPDIMEEALSREFDNIIPSFGYQLTPMVGIGGSAGAFPALQAFFEAMSNESGLIFVVILHLAPDHTSTLTEVLQRWTGMPVWEAEDGQPVEPNNVYVIPPAKHLTVVDGHLRLYELRREHGRRVVVDLFFRSLADTHGPHGAAIVLSGADGDGSLGVKRIKERGGLTIAQDPGEAEIDGMPRAAMASGMVDWVLNARDMPERLIGYFAQESRLLLPAEEGPVPVVAAREQPVETEAVFREILVFLRTRTGRDFSYYKRATILRRISRRMQVNSLDTMPAYLSFLRTHPGEAGALLKDLLISVTNFFRDREAFAALEAYIPALFRGKTQADTVRVWCPACATGEEAYSVAMLLVEYARTLDYAPGLQVFGCDLDDDAIQAARAGLFPEAIAADVSEARLRRFFTKEHRGYRVRRELREMVLFASHDLLKDAPFSRLDLISCRNLLIYLNREAQNRAFDIFHFALKPDGYLFLGLSESVEEGSPLFAVLDKRQRIYQRRSGMRTGLPVPTGPSSLLVRQIEQDVERAQVPPQSVVVPPASFLQSPPVGLQPAPGAKRDPSRLSWSDLHFRLIERFGPPSVLVDRDHEIQHLSESAGRFLQFMGGQPSANLLRAILPSLRVELRALLFRASQTGAPAEAFRLKAKSADDEQVVDLKVVPAHELAPGFLLVTFTPRDDAPDQGAQAEPLSVPSEPIVQHLERELEQMKSHLRDTVEQYEASTEELKASNEELQAMNEELRSATEELETSREELQSINEELTTVNHEARNKVEELGHANSALHNLMSATAIATLFLDRNLHVMRFTDSAAPIFNLIPGDLGRPISDMQHHIDYPELSRDAESVLEKLTPVMREVQGEGVSYLARMLPYRTQEDRIAGVVVTFVDITERERVKRELAEDLAASERLRAVADKVIGEDGSQALFDAIADAAIFLMHADSATLQLLSTEQAAPRMLAARRLPPALLEHLSRIEAEGTAAWPLPVFDGRNAFVDFSRESRGELAEFDRLHREFAGMRCMQTTVLLSRGGRRIGLLSTYWKSMHAPTPRELRYLDILSRQAADAIERQEAAESLREYVEELTRFNETAVGRENRMIELKQEINELTVRLGEKPRYALDFQDEGD